MKKTIIILLAAALVFSIAACTTNPTDTETTTAETTEETTAEETTTEETTDEITTEEVTEETTEEVTTDEATEEVTTDETTEDTTAADTAADDGKYVFEGVSIVLPEGFSVVSSGMTLAVYSDYPEHSDNISFVSAASDEFSNYTKETLESTYTTLFGSIENFTYEAKNEDGYDLVTVAFDVTYNGVPMHEKSCTYFFSGKSVTISFTSVSGEFDDAFDQAQKSIQIAK